MTDTSKKSEYELIERFSEEFDALCQIRHDTGAEEYGPIAFLDAPLFRMAAEEVADLANYSRYLYIRLRVLEEVLRARGIDLSASSPEEIRGEDALSFGASAFISAEEIQGFLSRKK